MRQVQPGCTRRWSAAYWSSPGSSASSTKASFAHRGLDQDRGRLRGPFGQRLAQPRAHRDRCAACSSAQGPPHVRAALGVGILYIVLAIWASSHRARRDHLRREGRRPDQARPRQQRGQRAAPDPRAHRSDRRPRVPSGEKGRRNDLVATVPDLASDLIGDLRRPGPRAPRGARAVCGGASSTSTSAAGGDAARGDRRRRAHPVARVAQRVAARSPRAPRPSSRAPRRPAR